MLSVVAGLEADSSWHLCGLALQALTSLSLMHALSLLGCTQYWGHVLQHASRCAPAQLCQPGLSEFFTEHKGMQICPIQLL